jgi:hypothetical protein
MATIGFRRCLIRLARANGDLTPIQVLNMARRQSGLPPVTGGVGGPRPGIRIIRLARARPNLAPAIILRLVTARQAAANVSAPHPETPQTRAYVVLDRSQRDPLPGAQVIQRRPSQRQAIDVTVVLRPKKGSTSLDFVSDVGRQPVMERRHPSRREFTTSHGADPSDIQMVQKFAREHGLAVIQAASVALGPSALKLRGTIGAFARAFRMQPRLFRYPGGLYRGHTGPIHIPKELDGVVQAVLGLDNRPVTRG